MKGQTRPARITPALIRHKDTRKLVAGLMKEGWELKTISGGHFAIAKGEAFIRFGGTPSDGSAHKHIIRQVRKAAEA